MIFFSKEKFTKISFAEKTKNFTVNYVCFSFRKLH
jgi:hypothetical protein